MTQTMSSYAITRSASSIDGTVRSNGAVETPVRNAQLGRPIGTISFATSGKSVRRFWSGLLEVGIG
jgi:hypothetical protein